MAGNYSSAGDITACSLTVNSGTVTVNTDDDFYIKEVVNVNGGTLTFENNANLIQTDNLANTGNIVYKRNATMKRLDYVYWGSPVAGQDLKRFSPYTVSLTNAPDFPIPTGSSRFYTLNESSNSFLAIAEPLGVPFDPAKGYMLRAPNNFPVNGSEATFSGSFTGVPNNGTYTVGITNTPLTGAGFNMLGNPYPSPINAMQFLTANPGTLYFWTHQTQVATSSSYATYNQMGATNPASGSLAPNGFIQAAQGFLLQTASNGSATFTNEMRAGNNSGKFFRTENAGKHRFWLSLSNAATPGINQILVGYMDGATEGFDNSVDGLLNYTGSSISSIIDNGKYAIQGRSLPFNPSDIVPLAFKAETAGTYTLTLDQFDGLFEGEQDIILKDNLTGAEQNLKAGAYSFATTAGSFTDRFSVIYQTTLGVENPGLDAYTIVVYKNNDVLHINAGATTMSSVKVFDIRGRLIYEKLGINATTTSLEELSTEQQVLLFQITSEGNEFVVKKVIN